MGLEFTWNSGSYQRINGLNQFVGYTMEDDANNNVYDVISGLVANATQNSLAGRGEARLLLVGKSCGGLLAWYTAARSYANFQYFDKVALVTVDGYGKVVEGSNTWYRREDEQFVHCWQGGSDGHCMDSWTQDYSRWREFGTWQMEDVIDGATWPAALYHGICYPYCPNNVNICTVEQYLGSDGHLQIETTQPTRQLIRDAIRFLLYDSE
jgi:hypothetical protein